MKYQNITVTVLFGCASVIAVLNTKSLAAFLETAHQDRVVVSEFVMATLEGPKGPDLPQHMNLGTTCEAVAEILSTTTLNFMVVEEYVSVINGKNSTPFWRTWV